MSSVSRIACSISAVMLLGMGGSVAAQSPDIEMGIDAAIQIVIPDDGENTTTVDVPISRFRFGNYVSDKTLVELGLGFNMIDTPTETASAGRGEISVSYHFTGDASSARAFLLVGGGGRFVHIDDDTTGQGFALGGLGVKVPIRRAVGIRFEVDYLRGFETDFFEATHEIRFLIGTSFFLGN
jgi:hypothetical protein